MSSFHFKKQRGVGLATAVFVITLLAVLALGINQLVQDNSESFVEEALLTRAFYAAESGAGFAMNGIYPPEGYPGYPEEVPGYRGTTCTGTPVTPVNYSFSIDGLVNCTAAVHCTSITVGSNNYLTIESQGTCGEVSRAIQVRTSY